MDNSAAETAFLSNLALPTLNKDTVSKSL